MIVGLENVTHCFPNFLQRQSNEIVPIKDHNKLQTSDRTSQTHLGEKGTSFFNWSAARAIMKGLTFVIKGPIKVSVAV